MVATSCRRGTFCSATGSVGQQGGAQFGQGGVLGAGNPDLAVELAAPANQQLVHDGFSVLLRAAHSAGV